jgi:SAM-dependent MidA family methyltransferase
MDLALYHPRLGYYARAVQRSGRAGDFFTSVDVGPLFGQLLAVQIAEMLQRLRSTDRGALDLVEAGAGNGRLATDVVRALAQSGAANAERLRLHLVESSPAARVAQPATLGDLNGLLASSSDALPASFEGVLFANELFDAMPVHQVIMRDEGLHEVFVDSASGELTTREGPLSTPRLRDYFADLDVTLEPGWKAEASLAAVDWIRDAARRLTRGYMILIDYGHDARELYSVTHSSGTLTSYSHHRAAGTESGPGRPPWLRDPGEQDLTAHVDFTSLRRAAEREGCVTLALLDQMYFVMALASSRLASLDVKERLALKTLLLPGGLGSTMKVLLLGKNVGPEPLVGCSAGVRLT